MPEPQPTDRSPPSTTRPLGGDLCLASVFQLRDLEHLDAIESGAASGFLYARDGHPNAARLARALADLDQAEDALVVSSGMAAIACIMLGLLRAGDRLAAAEDLYGRTDLLFRKFLPRLGIEARRFDSRDPESYGAAFEGSKVVYVEALSNPLLHIAPLEKLAAQAHDRGAMLVVDATFAPPPLCRAISRGADLVLHSLTKILSGHSDVTLGSIAGSQRAIGELKEVATTFGFHAAAMDCYLAERGLATLLLRLERASENAFVLAKFLAQRPEIAKVHYPGLELGAPHGFLLSIELVGGRERVQRFFGRLRRVPFAPSLGDVRTTVSYPWQTSHRSLAESERLRLGITPGLVRVSVGIEPSDLVAQDFLQALSD